MGTLQTCCDRFRACTHECARTSYYNTVVITNMLRSISYMHTRVCACMLGRTGAHARGACMRAHTHAHAHTPAAPARMPHVQARTVHTISSRQSAVGCSNSKAKLEAERALTGRHGERHTASSIQCAAHSVQHAAYSVQHAAYSVQHAAHSTQAGRRTD